MSKNTHYVRAYLCTTQFPSTLEELETFMYSDICCNLEDIIKNPNDNYNWSARNYFRPGDIVFLMLAKTADKNIKKLEKDAESIITNYHKRMNEITINSKDNILNPSLFKYAHLRRKSALKKSIIDSESLKSHISFEHAKRYEEGIRRCKDLYKVYGGKIFAIATVSSEVYFDDEKSDMDHWRDRYYADIDNLQILDSPLDYSEFRDFIHISQGGLTHVAGQNFDRLINKVIHENPHISSYYRSCKSSPIKMEINETNWLETSNLYHRQFILEEEFRKYYVDYLLRRIADDSTLNPEASTYVSSQNYPDHPDNLILLHGKYIAVEVKLNIHAEYDLERQCRQYTRNSKTKLKDGIQIDKQLKYQDTVLIIDTKGLYVYNVETDHITKVYDLDKLTNVSKIPTLKRYIRKFIK